MGLVEGGKEGVEIMWRRVVVVIGKEGFGVGDVGESGDSGLATSSSRTVTTFSICNAVVSGSLSSTKRFPMSKL